MIRTSATLEHRAHALLPRAVANHDGSHGLSIIASLLFKTNNIDRPTEKVESEHRTKTLSMYLSRDHTTPSSTDGHTVGTQHEDRRSVRSRLVYACVIICERIPQGRDGSTHLFPLYPLMKKSDMQIFEPIYYTDKMLYWTRM